MKKIIWRKNFGIKRVDLNIAIETMPGFGGLNHVTVGRNIISQIIWVNENLENTGTYMPKHELRELIRLTIKTIATRPEHVSRVHRQAIRLNHEYFALANSIRKMKLAKLSNKELLALHKKLFRKQFLSHCWALPTTWFVDSDGEDFSKYLLKLLRHRIRITKSTADSVAAFSTLTTPTRFSFWQRQDIDALKILELIKKTPKLKQWFEKHSTSSLEKTFHTLPAAWRARMLRHCEKWRWTPYMYLGPAYGMDYYLEVWKGLLKQRVDPKKQITVLRENSKKIVKERSVIAKKCGLLPREKHLFDIAAEMVWLKNFRKDCYYHGFFVLDQILAEVAKRSRLSLLQAKFLVPPELPKALAGRDYADIANERIKFSVIHGQGPKYKIMTGKEAAAFLKKQEFEKLKIVSSNELAGTPASPGKARGKIRIINLPEEMRKMNHGDIMLAVQTFPSLVPAMKKAAAIVTEEGGVTCHAAIVARELRTPCVVGVRSATKILKDGDMVEVDANKGVVRKI